MYVRTRVVFIYFSPPPLSLSSCLFGQPWTLWARSAVRWWCSTTFTSPSCRLAATRRPAKFLRWERRHWARRTQLLNLEPFLQSNDSGHKAEIKLFIPRSKQSRGLEETSVHNSTGVIMKRAALISSLSTSALYWSFPLSAQVLSLIS